MKAKSLLQRVGTILRTGLGGIFLLAGAAKIPVLSAFAGTISDVAHVSADTSFILAVTVVTIEIIGGLALLLRFMVVPTAVGLCLLMVFFLFTLVSAVFQGREIDCHCFGVLNIALENRHEILLDLVLFNLLAALALVSLAGKKEPTKGQAWTFTGLAVLFLYLQYAAFGNLILRDRATETPDLRRVISFLDDHHHVFPTRTEGNRVLFLLFFPDFNCPPCFDSFLRTSEIVGEILRGDAGQRVLAVFKSGGIADSAHPDRLHQWAERIGLQIPMIVAPDSVFESVPFEKSAVFVISPSGTILFSGSFPLDGRQMDSFTRHVRTGYGQRR